VLVAISTTISFAKYYMIGIKLDEELFIIVFYDSNLRGGLA